MGTERRLPSREFQYALGLTAVERKNEAAIIAASFLLARRAILKGTEAGQLHFWKVLESFADFFKTFYKPIGEANAIANRF